eukprot:524063-Hanusia_phi.AAC.3
MRAGRRGHREGMGGECKESEGSRRYLDHLIDGTPDRDDDGGEKSNSRHERDPRRSVKRVRGSVSCSMTRLACGLGCRWPDRSGSA